MILIVSGIILVLSIIGIKYYGFSSYSTTGLTFSLIGLYLSIFVGFILLGIAYPIREEVRILNKKEYAICKVDDGIILNTKDHLEKFTDIKTYNTPINELEVYEFNVYNSYNYKYKHYFVIE